MPVIAKALAIELLLHGVVDDLGPPQILFLRIHGRPLEGRKGLRHKEGRADADLALAVSLLFWYLVISDRDLIGKFRNCAHILLRLRGQPQHKRELYLVPAALKGHAGPLQDILSGQSLVDHIPEPLGTGLRREGQTALSHVLHLAHHIQGKGVDPQGGQRNIDALAAALVNQEIDQLR